MRKFNVAMLASIVSVLSLFSFGRVYGVSSSDLIDYEDVGVIVPTAPPLFAYIQCFGYLIALGIIISTIISNIKFKFENKELEIENSDEYKLKRKKLRNNTVQNIILAFIVFVAITMFGCLTAVAKPVIYLYPEQETEVNVSVGYPEKLSCVYPEYENDGWNVLAKPNGDLTDLETGRNYYCLYWEGSAKKEYKFEDGFVVTGEDSAKFLEEKLAILGLNEREANEFIIYWLPKLEVNKYNLIRFETVEEIENYMPLEITPEPDSVIRVIMDFKPLKRKIEIKEQVLETPKRTGFTVVEWGGSEF